MGVVSWDVVVYEVSLRNDLAPFGLSRGTMVMAVTSWVRGEESDDQGLRPGGPHVQIGMGVESLYRIGIVHLGTYVKDDIVHTCDESACQS